MKNVLMIMHAREIERCLDALKKLNIPKVWFRGFTEKELTKEINEFISSTDFDNYIIISDDTFPTQKALDIVQEGLEQEKVCTGWSNIQIDMKLANVSLKEIKGSFPSILSVDFASVEQVLKQENKFRTYFAGFSFTGMRRELWLKFPFQVWEYVALVNNSFVISSCCSDFMLSLRLQRNNIPIWCFKDAFVYHLASKENMIVGKVEKKVVRDF